MNREETIEFGQSLANELDKLINRYHPKSIQFEALAYEADFIREKCSFLAGNKDLNMKVVKAKLDSAFLKKHFKDNKKLVDRIIMFYIGADKFIE